MVTEDVRDRVTSYIKHQGAKSPDAIIDLVSTSQARFLDVVTPLADDVAAKPPGEGEWSLRELIRHVIAAEAGVARLVHDLARGIEAERRGGLGMTLDDDGRAFSAYVDELRATNTQMIDAVRAVPEDRNTTMTVPHPFFGPLNCTEWAAFQRVHDEDHVQHANKIIAAVTVSG